ncbi:MAG TPA: GNAT family N-acetyltransferase [Candidatus Limnocylindria bacterium]|nr:GNAT family N-acetyltransferase [Candidatus Limnocylindria bacterium]
MPDDPPSPALPLQPTEIAAGTLQLRVWEPAFLPAVLIALTDPEIRTWNPLRKAADSHLDDDALAAAWIERRSAWDGEHATWAVCDAVSGNVLGYVSLHDLNPTHRSGEVGYWVLPAARNHGVGRRAVAAACRYGFGALGLHRIELFHAVENVASCRVAEGAGFLFEGISRQAYRYGDDIFHDDHNHARLASDPDPR